MRLGTVLAGLFALLGAFVVLVWITNLGQSAAVDESQSVPVNSTSGNNTTYGRNPFEMGVEGPAPRLEIDETTHDFQRMVIGDHGFHSFEVRNVGEGTLKLAQGPTSCKCTVGTLGQDEVPPGGTAEVSLEWEGKSEEPMFAQTATIFTNDPAQPTLTLTIQGAVVPWLNTFPGDTWSIGAISETEETPFEFIIVSQMAESFTITGVESSSDLIHVGDITPIPQEDLNMYSNALCGYRLRGRIGLGFPVGGIREQLVVSTDVEQAEDLHLRIQSQRMGPYLVVGPGWHAALKLLELGRFDAADGKTVSVSFLVAEEDFQFTGVTVDPPVLEITWEEDATFESRTRRRIRVDVSAPPGMSPARWVREEPIQVSLATTDPDVPEWEFIVSLHAE